MTMTDGNDNEKYKDDPYSQQK